MVVYYKRSCHPSYKQPQYLREIHESDPKRLVKHEPTTLPLQLMVVHIFIPRCLILCLLLWEEQTFSTMLLFLKGLIRWLSNSCYTAYSTGSQSNVNKNKQKNEHLCIRLSQRYRIFFFLEKFVFDYFWAKIE